MSGKLGTGKGRRRGGGYLYKRSGRKERRREEKLTPVGKRVSVCLENKYVMVMN